MYENEEFKISIWRGGFWRGGFSSSDICHDNYHKLVAMGPTGKLDVSLKCFAGMFFKIGPLGHMHGRHTGNGVCHFLCHGGTGIVADNLS
eukprot:6464716-Amphidinium_carterae.3